MAVIHNEPFSTRSAKLSDAYRKDFSLNIDLNSNFVRL